MAKASFGVFALSVWTFLLTLFTLALAGVLLWQQPKAVPVSRPVPQIEPTPPDPAVARPVAPRAVQARGDLANFEKTAVEIFQSAEPSVVYITTLAVRSDPFRRNLFAIPQGTGSGFLWDDAGHVVTNYHVVRAGDAARVTLADQTVWDASLVGYYADADIAVLKIAAPAEVLVPLQVGSSADLQVGQSVFAIGNPFGLDHTLSTGVVSGTGREIPSVGGRPIQGAIQTDAAINPGNSGGPLLDSAGRLIGINTQIYSPSGASAGVGFAVPVDTVARVVPELIEHGRVTRPVLGVQIDEGGLSERYRIKGVIVVGVVPGSGAAEAGIRSARLDRRTGAVFLGDVITSIDDSKIESPSDLYRALDEKEVGQRVQVGLNRFEGRGSTELMVTLRLTSSNGR